MSEEAVTPNGTYDLPRTTNLVLTTSVVRIRGEDGAKVSSLVMLDGQLVNPPVAIVIGDYVSTAAFPDQDPSTIIDLANRLRQLARELEKSALARLGEEDASAQLDAEVKP